MVSLLTNAAADSWNLVYLSPRDLGSSYLARGEASLSRFGERYPRLPEGETSRLLFRGAGDAALLDGDRACLSSYLVSRLGERSRGSRLYVSALGINPRRGGDLSLSLSLQFPPRGLRDRRRNPPGDRLRGRPPRPAGT